MMTFGDNHKPASPDAPGEWIARSGQGPWGTVGALVPNQFNSLLRVYPPELSLDDWWSAYRDLYDVVASIGERHTSSPNRAWFAIWEGHGFDTSSSTIAWSEPAIDNEDRRGREASKARQEAANLKRNAAIRRELDQIPTFNRPHRTYHLVEGTVQSVTELRYPDGEGWRNPDLFWPDDQSWFIATDVDFWSLYIAGSAAFIAEVAESVPTRSEPAVLDDPLPIED